MTFEDYVSLIDTQVDFMENYSSRILKTGFAGPVLLLSSKNETAGTPKMRRDLLKAYPHAEFHQFEAGGHHPALLHLGEYRHAVEDFLLAHGHEIPER